MKAMNLYLVTRAAYSADFPLLVSELTGTVHREYSRHEAESLRSLTDALVPFLTQRERAGGSWVSYLDGFYFSYTIAHISKEFDLLKISADGECVLNIELKSEAIEEERICKQLMQNRYYLSHISRSIYSYTYVMETGTLYVLNDKGHMRTASVEELADVLCRPLFYTFVEKDLDLYFRAADYLISPAAEPEKFLQGSYFLTNQQEEFKRRILEALREGAEQGTVPFIVVTGGGGTGKTLLLYDLSLALSKKKRVLLMHGGKLQSGHKAINERLRNVDIIETDSFDENGEYAFLLADVRPARSDGTGAGHGRNGGEDQRPEHTLFGVHRQYPHQPAGLLFFESAVPSEEPPGGSGLQLYRRALRREPQGCAVDLCLLQGQGIP